MAGDDFVRTLNRDYRGRDEATNVLSFPGEMSHGTDQAPGLPILLGDVVVAFGVTQKEASSEDWGTSLSDHLSHLIIHGVLHLLGFDHQTEPEATAMEGLETQLIQKKAVKILVAGAEISDA